MTIPTLRFKADDSSKFGEWKSIQLKDIAERIARKNKEENQNALTISAQMGLVNQQAYFSKQIASRDLSKYYLLHKGEYAYNKSYSAGYPMGAIKRLKLYEKGVVSTLYICFSLNKQVNSDFFEQYVESGNLVPELEKIAQEGARNHGLLNISLQEFFEINLIVPCLKEQMKIATFLSAVDKKISQLSQKLHLLGQYKQGMMQQLFSQKIRFKADDGSDFGEWEEKELKDVADVKGGKRIPKGFSLVSENTGHPYITVSDMNRSYGIDDTNIRYVPLEVVDVIKRYTITDNDIFISVAGTLGIIGKIPPEFNGANLTENADKLTNLKCHQNFLIYLLDSGYLSELIESTATTSAQPKLALYAIEQLEVNLPCLEEQTKIADFLSTIDQKMDVVSEQLKQAKTWKKGLLQQMFV